MLRILFFFLFACFISLSGPAWGQDQYYVQSLKAKIMSAPSFKAAIVAEAGKGTKLIASGKEGSWIKVGFGQKQGYVSSLLLSKNPPMEKVTLIKGNEDDIKQSVRRRASTYTSAAAARGLTQDDRRRLSTHEKVDYDGLEKVEAFTVTSEEVARFMEGNKL
jgi:hypothetical protein